MLRGRVCAALAVARALGDHQFKDPALPQEQQMVTPCPDITFIDRNSSDDEFLVIACDGVYDVMSNAQVMQHVRHNLFSGESIRTHAHARTACTRCTCLNSHWCTGTKHHPNAQHRALTCVTACFLSFSFPFFLKK